MVVLAGDAHRGADVFYKGRQSIASNGLVCKPRLLRVGGQHHLRSVVEAVTLTCALWEPGYVCPHDIHVAPKPS